MIKRAWFAVGVMLSALGVFVPSTSFAQHGPGRHSSGSVQREHAADPATGPVYDATSEATFGGTVADVKGGRSVLDRILRIHTLGVGPQGVQQKRLLLKTNTETVEIQLGPTAFLTGQKVEIRKGDTLEVTGSRITIGESHIVLAREIRKGDHVWALRDVTGQPLWRAVETQPRGFWTKKKVLLAVAVVKVVALATVLRH